MIEFYILLEYLKLLIILVYNIYNIIFKYITTFLKNKINKLKWKKILKWAHI